MAGCAKRVPSAIRSKGSASSSAQACSKRSGRSVRATSLIPGVWLPWPGKRIAARGEGAFTERILLRGRAVVTGIRPYPRHPGGRERTLGGSLDQDPQALGLARRLGAVADAELAIDGAGVLLDRVGGEVQEARDLL